jgi:uncharacterized membrane protein YkvA (DUF1232 family)
MKENPKPSPDLPRDAGFWSNLARQLNLIWRLFKDRRVSGWLKLIPIAGLVYLLSPIDLLPDFMLPGLGELDDITVILLSLKMFVDLAPPDLVREHLQKLMGRVGDRQPSSDSYIDASYHVLGDEEQSKESE